MCSQLEVSIAILRVPSFLAPQTECPEPCIDLAEGILLPLVG